MMSSFNGLLLGILLTVALTGLIAMVGASIYLMTRRSCPHCHTMTSKRIAACSNCGKDTVIAG